MECHYKVLGVELNADDSAIKKAYRKAALKYHPDKNLHCLEEATEKFRLVQAAYDVLSDPQERAWYDRHREEILHRKKYENYKENSLDLWEYFSPSAYKGFGDDENGFYAVYCDVFKKIDAEDQPFRDDNLGEEEWLPVFGNSKSDYDNVVHVFYSSWQAYCTQLSYVWESQYDVKEAPNRRIARMIEKENKKERDKHKKKRNELVRELVAFVRKRDPRVKTHKLELERLAAEQAQKAEEKRMSAMRARAEEAALYDEANKEDMIRHHERVSELENMMKNEFGFSSSEDEAGSENDSDEAEYSDDLFCVACDKLFKSKMGLKNHQRSKKHKENMNRLKQEMEEDPLFYDDTTEAKNENSNDYSDSIDEQDFSSCTKLSKKQKKQKRQQQKLLNNMMNSDPLSVDDFKEPGSQSDNNKSLDYMENLEKNSIPNAPEEVESESELACNGDTTKVSDEGTHEKSSNKSKSKKKRQKKKQQQQPNQINLDSVQEPLGCGKCNEIFRSRNKLFQHLKKTGHSLPLEDSKTGKRKSARSKQ